MSRPSHVFAVLTAWSLLTPAALAQQQPLDLIPADASFALLVKSLAGVRDKGEQFFKDNDVDPNKAPRPTRLFEQGLGLIGVRQGLDLKGACALLLPDLKKVGITRVKLDDGLSMLGVLAKLVVVIPVADLEEMAGNFKLKKKDLRPGKIVDGPQLLGRSALLYRNKNLLLGLGDRKAVQLIASGKPLSRELSRRQVKALSAADVVLHFGPEAWGEIYRGLLADIRRALTLEQGKADNKVVDQFVAALGKVRFATGGLTLGKQSSIDLVASLGKGKDADEALKFLSALRGGPGASDLVGLPAVEPLIAYAAKGDGVKNVHLARALLRVLLDKWLGIEVHMSEADRQKFLEAFEVMYRHLKGSRSVVYFTDKAKWKKIGQVASVVILDVDDTEAHVKRWATLVEVANSSGPRILRQDRLSSPRFVFKPKAETIGGAPVDWVTVEVPGLKPEVKRGYEMLMGPDWNKLRLVVQGKRVVGLFGSDVDTLKQTLANLKEGKKGLAEHKAIVAALKRLDPERKIELHFCLENWAPFMQSDSSTEPTIKPVRDLTSLALTVEEGRVGLQIRSAGAEQKQIVKLLGLSK
jgi:hypothetical protein